MQMHYNISTILLPSKNIFHLIEPYSGKKLSGLINVSSSLLPFLLHTSFSQSRSGEAHLSLFVDFLLVLIKTITS
jgi:hypothetical protein